MKILKAVSLLLIAVMLTSASAVRARTLHGVVLSADDNGNCKDKGLHKGNSKGRCGPDQACLTACDVTAANSSATCLSTYDPIANCAPDDALCISEFSALLSVCVADANAAHAACVANCSAAP